MTQELALSGSNKYQTQLLKAMSSAHATALIVIVPIRHPIFEFSYDLSRSIKMTCLQLKNPHILEYLDLNRTKKTENSQIEQNITKARRTAYSLLSTGFYGKNWLDPITRWVVSLI
jgi:hypothetical protein